MRIPQLTLLLLVAACGGEETFQIGNQVADCDLTLDNLDGSTWVMLEAMPDKTERANPMARLKFKTKDGVLQAKYTAKSLGDVYTYECEKRTKGKGKSERVELFCGEKPRLTDWCQSLMINDKDACTKSALKKLGATNATDEELVAAIKEARENYKKYMGTKNERQWRFNNNNLGNKLRGMVFVTVDKRQCRLTIADMYMTIYNGKKLEDFNPVGTNPFVRSEDEFLWKHCTGQLVDLETADAPKDLSKIGKRKHSADKPIYYHYFGDKGVKAKDGCTYSYDSYAQWRPVEKDVAAKSGKGKVKWKSKHKFAADELVEVGPGRKTAVYHMVRYKDCDGKKKNIDTVCNAVPIK